MAKDWHEALHHSKMNKQGIYPDLVELLINNGVTDKTFLQDEEKMLKLSLLLIAPSLLRQLMKR